MMINFMMRLSPHFRLGEFCKSDYGIVHPTRVQIYLAKRLALDILEPIRNHFDSPIVITSGIRNKAIWDAIARKARERGLPPPSKSTDHSYFDEAVNKYGVGAVDFFVEGVETEDVFLWAKDNLTYGQIIIYPEWHFIHISNPKNVLFSDSFVDSFFIKKKVLEYKDGRYRKWQKST